MHRGRRLRRLSDLHGQRVRRSPGKLDLPRAGHLTRELIIRSRLALVVAAGGLATSILGCEGEPVAVQPSEASSSTTSAGGPTGSGGSPPDAGLDAESTGGL